MRNVQRVGGSNRVVVATEWRLAFSLHYLILQHGHRTTELETVDRELYFLLNFSYPPFLLDTVHHIQAAGQKLDINPFVSLSFLFQACVRRHPRPERKRNIPPEEGEEGSWKRIVLSPGRTL